MNKTKTVAPPRQAQTLAPTARSGAAKRSPFDVGSLKGNASYWARTTERWLPSSSPTDDLREAAHAHSPLEARLKPALLHAMPDFASTGIQQSARAEPMLQMQRQRHAPAIRIARAPADTETSPEGNASEHDNFDDDPNSAEEALQKNHYDPPPCDPQTYATYVSMFEDDGPLPELFTRDTWQSFRKQILADPGLKENDPRRPYLDDPAIGARMTSHDAIYTREDYVAGKAPPEASARFRKNPFLKSLRFSTGNYPREYLKMDSGDWDPRNIPSQDFNQTYFNNHEFYPCIEPVREAGEAGKAISQQRNREKRTKRRKLKYEAGGYDYKYNRSANGSLGYRLGKRLPGRQRKMRP